MRRRQFIELFPRALTALALGLAFSSASASADGFCGQGWCWQSPLPQGTAFGGVWASSSNDVWVTGNAGTLLHWDGSTWVPFEGGAALDKFLNVWGSGPNDVWAVGYNSFPELAGPILHWDGTSWQRSLTVPRLVEGIWGTGPTDVWAAGGTGSDVDGILLHYDGSCWSEVEVPGGLPMMHAIWGTSSDDLYVGGLGRLIHWDGSAWMDLNLPEPIEIYDLWGSDTNNVWASGTALQGARARIAHWDGRSVSIIHLSEGGSTCERIWGSQPDNIWVTVGGVGASEPITKLYHWDGIIWNLVQPGPTVRYLEGIRGIAADDIWAVGNSGLILHWTGSSWDYDWSNPAGRGRARSVKGSSEQDVWLAANAGSLAHWDGQSWSSVQSGVSADLYATWSNSLSDAWVAGQGGVLLLWNGMEWASVASGTDNLLYALWGAASDDVWAAGAAGTIVHWNGSEWLPAASGTDKDLRGLSGTASNDVWAVGESDALGVLVLHWDGTAWSRSPSPHTANTLFGVASISPNDAWAVGEVVVHWDGDQWSRVETGLPVPFDMFQSVWARSSDDVFMSTSFGSIAHWDGAEFTNVLDRSDTQLFSIWGTQNDVWAVGVTQGPGDGLGRGSIAVFHAAK